MDIPHTVFKKNKYIGTTYGTPCSLCDGENYRSFALCVHNFGWSCAGLRRRGNSSRRHLPLGSVTKRSLQIGAWHTEESAQVVVQFYTSGWYVKLRIIFMALSYSAVVTTHLPPLS